MSYQSKASALFVGFEVITGKVNGKSGRFTLQHSGRFENGVAVAILSLFLTQAQKSLSTLKVQVLLNQVSRVKLAMS